MTWAQPGHESSNLCENVSSSSLVSLRVKARKSHFATSSALETLSSELVNRRLLMVVWVQIAIGPFVSNYWPVPVVDKETFSLPKIPLLMSDKGWQSASAFKCFGFC